MMQIIQHMKVEIIQFGWAMPEGYRSKWSRIHGYYQRSWWWIDIITRTNGDEVELEVQYIISHREKLIWQGLRTYSICVSISKLSGRDICFSNHRIRSTFQARGNRGNILPLTMHSHKKL